MSKEKDINEVEETAAGEKQPSSESVPSDKVEEQSTEKVENPDPTVNDAEGETGTEKPGDGEPVVESLEEAAPADEEKITEEIAEDIEQAQPAEDATEAVDTAVITAEDHEGPAQPESGHVKEELLAEKPEPAATEEPDDDTGSDASSDEELHSEEDLSERDEDHEDHDEEEEVDYSNLSKEELVEVIKGLAKEDRIVRADNIAREIKPYFDEIRDRERAEALEKFKAEGGEEADFDFKSDELTNRFDANFKLIRDRKTDYIKNRESQKEQNLKKKQEILEKLREFVDSDEDTNISFDAFKELQNEWKSIGQVPGAYAKTLWANYNALLDRFYDNRSIYFELKELDRRKNLEAKNELVNRAEELSKVENMRDATRELNELHHEFKHIGPVPKEEQEPLWQRFKAASDAVYDRRKDFVDNLKKELEENLVAKQKLVDEVKGFLSFDSDRIKEWNNKTREIIEIQKRWEAIGGLPRAKAKEVNKAFWSSFKSFFANKSDFFKRLDAKREGNLEKKRELIKQAEGLKESTDWQKTAEAFKRLQREWKEIGPVPEKYRESAYQEFKAPADYFFDRKRSSNKEVEKEYEVNLEKKLQVCSQIEEMAEQKDEDVDKFRDLRDEYEDTGFVPRKNISEIKSKYAEAVDKYINSLEDYSNEDRQKLRLENQVNRIAHSPNADHKLYRKEQAIRKQIGKVESDIALWKNNLEFFAESKTADKLKDEFNDKIKAAQGELKNLKVQLKLIRQA